METKSLLDRRHESPDLRVTVLAPGVDAIITGVFMGENDVNWRIKTTGNNGPTIVAHALKQAGKAFGESVAD